MKVLYIANFKDGTGYSHAAIHNVRAMNAVGVDVVIRNIYLNSANIPLSDELQKLENKDSRGVDVVVQHTLPHFMEKHGSAVNIGCFYCETDNFRDTGWQDNLNLMDAVWVPDAIQEFACLQSGVNTEIIRIPVPCDIEKYSQSYDKIYIPELQNKFVFYFIGEFTRRKNIGALLKAFHSTFHPSEPVELVLKLNIPGKNKEQANEEIGRYIREIKTGLRIYPNESDYKKEIVITDYMPEDAVMRLHETCHCFVMPSFGEGWNLPAFDAMAMGKTPIVTSRTGMATFITEDTGYTVLSLASPCFGVLDSVEGLYTANQYWRDINVLALSGRMRNVYQTPDPKIIAGGINFAQEFSYDKIGQQIKEQLCNLL